MSTIPYVTDQQIHTYAASCHILKSMTRPLFISSTLYQKLHTKALRVLDKRYINPNYYYYYYYWFWKYIHDTVLSKDYLPVPYFLEFFCCQKVDKASA